MVRKRREQGLRGEKNPKAESFILVMDKRMMDLNSLRIILKTLTVV